MNEIVDVAVIGGGASGTLVASNLLRACAGPAHFALITSETEPGRGVAYGTGARDHLLNVPAGGMSAFAERPDHFVDWARLVMGDVEPSTFLPRRLYGGYLEDVLGGSIERGRRIGARLTELCGRAVSVEELPAEEGALVSLADGRQLIARRVVLALGNFPPARVPGLPIWLENETRYVNDPWSAGALNGLQGLPRLLLVGTGLTMYDIFLTLQTQTPDLRVTAVSRNGLRPEAHTDPPPPPPVLTFDRSSTLNEIAEAVGSDADNWRAKIDSVRPLTPGLWAALSIDERREFLARWRRLWDVKRHRAAPQIHHAIEAAVSDGFLSFDTAEISDVRREQGLVVALRRGDITRDIKVDAIVNCTGPQSDYRDLDDPLVAQLRSSGVLTPCPFGLGVETDGSCALVAADGSVSSTVFAVGPPTKPMLWEITAIPEIRQQTQALAVRLLDQLRPLDAPALV